jgi:PDZ domain-containing protein
MVSGTESAPEPAELPRNEQLLSFARRHWKAVSAGSVVLVAVMVIAVLSFVHVPYVIEGPGAVYPTEERISVPPDKSFPTKDVIGLVTVTLDSRVTATERFWAEHFGDGELHPAKEVLGSATPAQNDRLNQVLMRQSKDVAVLVALEKLGYDVHPTATGAVVDEVVDGSPAVGKVDAGDTIVAVDDQPVTNTQDLHDRFGAHQPGDTVNVTLENPDNVRRTITVTLGQNPETKAAFLGVAPEDRLVYPDLPFAVTLDSGTIGGPSAGLAFTLGLLDALTPGDLTGGNAIACTGTIGADGTVGPIGGVKEKVITVHRDGRHIKYFLVPAENLDEAKQGAPPDLTIVGVHTLDEALTFLQTIGGTGLPAPATASGP